MLPAVDSGGLETVLLQQGGSKFLSLCGDHHPIHPLLGATAAQPLRHAGIEAVLGQPPLAILQQAITAVPLQGTLQHRRGLPQAPLPLPQCPRIILEKRFLGGAMGQGPDHHHHLPTGMHPGTNAPERRGNLPIGANPWGAKAPDHVEAAPPVFFHAVHKDPVKIQGKNGGAVPGSDLGAGILAPVGIKAVQAAGALLGVSSDGQWQPSGCTGATTAAALTHCLC